MSPPLVRPCNLLCRFQPTQPPTPRPISARQPVIPRDQNVHHHCLTLFLRPSHTHVGGEYLDLVLDKDLFPHAIFVSLIPTILSDHNAFLTTHSVSIFHSLHRFIKKKFNIPVPLQSSFQTMITSWYATHSFTSANELYISLLTHVSKLSWHLCRSTP